MLTLAHAGLDEDRIAALRDAAERARATSYARYSRYLVLAAVEAEAGVFGGSNVECSNYTLTKHAEEVAMLAAIGAGAGPSGGWIRALYTTAVPCGSCRQFAYEFSGPDTLVVIERISLEALTTTSLRSLAGTDPEVWLLRDLLPAAFGPIDLTA
jgi:cytidine deaminase